MLTKDFEIVFIIGAGRSGTKILRDTLATHPAIDAVPYDVNYIWRIGLNNQSDDIIGPKEIKAKNKTLIKKLISRFRDKAPVLVEKTVSNTLRIPLLDEMFPDAKYIHIIRHGVDVTESVMRQWGESRELSYVFKKLKTFPVLHSFSYLLSYFTDWVKLRIKGESRWDYIWGVKYSGFRKDLKSKSIAQVCATQWKSCVETSMSDIANMPEEKVLEIRYEDFINSPKMILSKIASHLNIEDVDRFDYSRLRPTYIGKGYEKLSKEKLKEITHIINPTLKKLGYV